MTFQLVSREAAPDAGSQTVILPALHNDGPAQYALERQVAVDGADLIDAHATVDQRTHEWVVTFELNSAGAQSFAAVTRANVGRPFAIVLDGKVVSAPIIREPILGGRGEISGHFTPASANELAVMLRAGALPVPLTILEERTVGPDLGADAIHQGITACIIGAALVVAFMILSYGLFGVFASLALGVNLVLVLGVLSALHATLSLPGIVGILLTIGMAVDANVLINERIREEAQKGRTPINAVQTGFSRAFATILDANLTTLLKMLILFGLAAGAVKGFAVTISLGILTSMFTALVLVKMLIWGWFKRARRNELPLLGKWRLRMAPDDTRIAFMRGRVAGLVVSAALSLASATLFVYPGLTYGTDFRGGIAIEVRTAQDADFTALRRSLGTLGLGAPALQQFGSPHDVLVRLEQPEGGDLALESAVGKVRETLARDFPGAEVRRVEAVGATVSKELFRSGVTALGLALLAMLGYIWWRFEWQFGVGAVATLLLDVTKLVGFYALTGFEFNLTSIVAILTVMGYSINDKVVVYDRVRENLKRWRRMPLRELIDLSINETLARTVATSMTVLLALAPLVILAGEGLRQFVIALLVGLAISTSSSIFIAAPILLFLGRYSLRVEHRGSVTPPAVAARHGYAPAVTAGACTPPRRIWHTLRPVLCEMCALIPERGVKRVSLTKD
jgi:SecD/SecF fusion protein